MKPMRPNYFKQSLLLMFIVSLCLSSRLAPARAESASAVPSELDALRDELKGINTRLDGVQKEVERIRPLLRQRSVQPTPPGGAMATVSFAGRPTLGHKEAPLTLIDFSDYQCPFCARFAQTVLPALKAEYVDTGKLRYVFRDFPLDQMHPHARKAAEAAHCSGDQGQYWAMHDLLFQNQKALQADQFKAYAHHLNLDPIAFEICMAQGKYTAEVQQDYDDGVAAGVQGTPGFFLGRTRPDDAIQGLFIKGAQPVTTFRQVINRLLGEATR
jgi:protein-disulfide isomerase